MQRTNIAGFALSAALAMSAAALPAIATPANAATTSTAHKDCYYNGGAVPDGTIAYDYGSTGRMYTLKCYKNKWGRA